jgi:hypothetical protein
MRTIPTTHWRKFAGRIACMIVLGALLAGCDKCGDWWWGAQAQDGTQSCKNALPKNLLPNSQ